jgi:hypothetical protein
LTTLVLPFDHPLPSLTTTPREKQRENMLGQLERQLLRQRMRAEDHGGEDTEVALEEARLAAFMAWQRATAHVFAGEWRLGVGVGVGVGGPPEGGVCDSLAAQRGTAHVFAGGYSVYVGVCRGEGVS